MTARDGIRIQKQTAGEECLGRNGLTSISIISGVTFGVGVIKIPVRFTFKNISLVQIPHHQQSPLVGETSREPLTNGLSNFTISNFI